MGLRRGTALQIKSIIQLYSHINRIKGYKA
jgi:hypothetical protein